MKTAGALGMMGIAIGVTCGVSFVNLLRTDALVRRVESLEGQFATTPGAWRTTVNDELKALHDCLDEARLCPETERERRTHELPR